MIPYEQIRLIVSDVDGTLLRYGSQTLDSSLVALVRRIQALGVHFVVASGRQYPNLIRLFSPLRDEIVFAPENGAIVMYRGQTLRQEIIPREIGLELMRDIQAQPDCQLIVSGKHTSYIPTRDRQLMDWMLYHYHNTVTAMDDITQVKEEFIKISACTPPEKTRALADVFRQRWEKRFSVMVAGDEWIDFGHTGKEHALAFLMEDLHLSPQQVMVFGDNFNDEGMMRAAGYPWAMDTSDEYLQSLCGRTCHRVEDVLEEFLAARERPGCP